MESNLPPEMNPQPAPPPPPAPSYNRPPPVIAPLPVTRPARRGTGWMILAIILMVLLMVSVLPNCSQGFTTAMGRRVTPYHTAVGPRFEEVTLRESRYADKIVVIPIAGIITGQPVDQGGFSMVTVIKEQLKRAKKDSDVKAVILKVDSPGGEVLASDDIAKAITEFQKSGKPVV